MSKKFNLLHTHISLEALFELMPVAMVLIDRYGRNIAFNQKLRTLHGFTPNTLLRRRVKEFCQKSAANIERDFYMHDKGLDVPDHEIQINNKIYLVAVKPIRDKSGFAVGEMASLTDITRQKNTERELVLVNKQLEFLANNDPLTGLLNTRTYYKICEKLITIAHRNDTPFSVLFIDLDYFKNINDTYGHDVGDIVLKTVSKCIVDLCRESDIVGRVGGEEFSIFLPETDNTSAINFAEKLRAKIELLNPSIGEDKNISITASIGVASKMVHHKAITDIQRDADHAMYHAKKNGRNRVSCLVHPCYVEAKKEK
ncbi:sensor domain-containing diguanylate cyclase [Sulfurospirillum cavolei]|uniref:sensor domain-containing diguanylate cyclase n=1 Tax=Sulfurospirillum cavolei TaxID=366522 RepID=UPI000694CF8E|nr:sensor domain-containing diguanylate cyclase [Sulfurospirillum cavolei]